MATRAADPQLAERILHAAEGAIEHFGLRRFTMSDVARAADIRRQAVYEHVGSRDDLVRAILQAKAERLHDRANAVIAKAPDFSSKILDGLLFIVEDSLTEPYMQGLMGEGDFAMVSKIVGADELMPKLTSAIWRPVLESADASGELAELSRYEEIERWLTYVTLMLVGARAQGISDRASDRRLLSRMLLPALLSGTKR
jgi:AcrR family transcriptional regulator